MDTTTEAGRAASGLVRRLAALDRSVVRERINAGLATPRAKGRRGGRPAKLTAQKRRLIADAVLSGRSTGARMARLHKVSEATVSRAVAAHRTGEMASSGDDGAAMGQASPGQGEVPSALDVLPASVLDERLAIVGTSGSGKTYAAKGLVEQVMECSGRVCVVDPLGVWWGLRARADDSAVPSAYPIVVFGGAHEHVHLDENMGAALGHLIRTHALACVVDVSDLGSSVVRRAFMTAFTEALYAANTQPLHLVLDEADLWAPQRAQPGGHELLGRVEEIVRRGRMRGFRPWLITQRPAVLHKDVLSQADVLVSMKLTSSQDWEAVGRWIEGQADRAEGRRILGALPRLRPGEGWVWAPSDDVLAQVAFPRICTWDSSSAPQWTEQATAPGTLAAVDLRAIAAALGGTAASTARERDDAAPGGLMHLEALGARLSQRNTELSAARARVAEMEAHAAALEARLARAEAQRE